jgi:MinD superfamily P-loop ATPase
MRLTVASGKGGTGKTTVATNLAVTAAEDGLSVQLLDCDVEEPNCHLFLRPKITSRRPVTVAVPVIDAERCNGCGACGEICAFNALAVLPNEVMVFAELCHGCTGCWLVCPEEAIRPGQRVVGELALGTARGVAFGQGELRIGEAQAPPLIRAVRAAGGDAELTVVDAPPGTSCPVVAAARGSDFVVLVTEPTPFGLNDLILAVGMVRQLDVPFGVVVNRSDSGDDRVVAYCAEQEIPILLQIRHERPIAEAYARGELAVDAVPRLRRAFRGLLATVRDAATAEPAVEPGGSP